MSRPSRPWQLTRLVVRALVDSLQIPSKTHAIAFAHGLPTRAQIAQMPRDEPPDRMGRVSIGFELKLPKIGDRQENRRCVPANESLRAVARFVISFRVTGEPRPAVRRTGGMKHRLGTGRALRICRFSKARDPFLTTFSKPFPPLE